jgi:hypothetical protein
MSSDKIFQSDDSLKLSAESISTIISSMNNGDSQVKKVPTLRKKQLPPLLLMNTTHLLVRNLTPMISKVIRKQLLLEIVQQKP